MQSRIYIAFSCVLWASTPLLATPSSQPSENLYDFGERRVLFDVSTGWQNSAAIYPDLRNQPAANYGFDIRNRTVKNGSLEVDGYHPWESLQDVYFTDRFQRLESQRFYVRSAPTNLRDGVASIPPPYPHSIVQADVDFGKLPVLLDENEDMAKALKPELRSWGFFYLISPGALAHLVALMRQSTFGPARHYYNPAMSLHWFPIMRLCSVLSLVPETITVANDNGLGRTYQKQVVDPMMVQPPPLEFFNLMNDPALNGLATHPELGCLWGGLMSITSFDNVNIPDMEVPALLALVSTIQPLYDAAVDGFAAYMDRFQANVMGEGQPNTLTRSGSAQKLGDGFRIVAREKFSNLTHHLSLLWIRNLDPAPEPLPACIGELFMVPYFGNDTNGWKLRTYRGF